MADIKLDDSKRDDAYFYDYQYKRNQLTWALCPAGGDYNTAIIKGILSDEHFSFSAAHSYSSEDTMQAVEGAISGILKGARGVSKTLDASEKMLRWAAEKSGSDVVKQGLNSFYDSYHGVMDYSLPVSGNDTATVGSLMWGKFVSMISHIKYYDGTSVNFSIPQLSTIYFDGDDGVTIAQRLDYYNERFMGVMKNIDVVKAFGASSAPENTGIAGIMTAPSSTPGEEYKPIWGGDILQEFPGSYRLYIGDKYLLKNLVISNYSVNLSTVTHKGSSQPLYMEVSLSIEPASYIDSTKLRDCIIFMN